MKYPLLPYSQLVYETSKESADTYKWGPIIFRINKQDVDVSTLRQSILNTIKHHPAFQMVIDDNGQEYCHREVATKGRFHLFEIADTGNEVVVSVWVYRILGDYYSWIIFTQDVFKSYKGERLKHDDYVGYLKRIENLKKSLAYQKHAKTLRDQFGNLNCPTHPKTDYPLNISKIPQEGIYLDLYDRSDQGLSFKQCFDTIEKKHHISLNAFFCLSVALAIMDYEGTDDAALTWAYIGRTTIEEQNIFGSLHKDIPLKIHRSNDRNVLFRQIRNQIREGISHSDYPFTLTHPHSAIWNYATNVIQQPNYYEVLKHAPFPLEIEFPTPNPDKPAYCLLDIEIEENENDKPLCLTYRYSATHYKADSIKSFADLVKRNAEWLIGGHHKVTKKLIDIFDENIELRECMKESLRIAALSNPDIRMNPVRSLQSLYIFLDNFLTSMPWQSLGLGEEKSLFRRIDQSTGYFLFLFDQPIDRLKDRGFLYPSIQYVPEIGNWIKEYNTEWAVFLNSPESWNNNYYEEVANDELFGLKTDWYEPKENWHCWNDFFARKLFSKAARPIGDANVVAPSDGVLQPWISIDSNNILIVPKSIHLKTYILRSVANLLYGSPYQNDFSNGVLVHIMLDFYHYHHIHCPVNGKVLDKRIINGISGSGGVVTWDKDREMYAYNNPNELGFQMIETRGVLIIQTDHWGKIAIVPVGMAQVCSVNWSDNAKIGAELKKGDEIGFFLCGGSDVVIIFQDGIEITCLRNTNEELLVGDNLCNIKIN